MGGRCRRRRRRQETGGTLQRCRSCWGNRVDGLAPGCSVDGRDQLLHWNGGEVGIAEVVGAVHVGAPEGFGDEVGLLRRAIAHFSEVVAGEDVEDLEQDRAAGRWRRRGEDRVAAIGADERIAVFFYFVGGEIGGGDQSPALLDGGGKFGGQGAFVERGGIGGDALERGGELWLREAVAGFVEVAVALEEAAGIREELALCCRRWRGCALLAR